MQPAKASIAIAERVRMGLRIEKSFRFAGNRCPDATILTPARHLFNMRVQAGVEMHCV